MSKNRIIPFGYCMRNGEITVDFNESKAVARIFEEYLNGSSLQQIAKLMESEKIRYSEDSGHWNKNMIKRIIENIKYLGNEKYPQIIGEKFFAQANEKRMLKATSVCVIPCAVPCSSADRRKPHLSACSRRFRWTSIYLGAGSCNSRWQSDGNRGNAYFYSDGICNLYPLQRVGIRPAGKETARFVTKLSTE